MINLKKMKAPGDHRPTWRGGVIQIHITRACNLACSSCTQGSNLSGKPTVITLDQFHEAVTSLKDYPGVVGIFGGNPVLHPQFQAICKILRDEIPYEQRGVWCNDPRGKGQTLRDTFNPDVSNLNVHAIQSAYDEFKKDWPESKPFGLEPSRHSPPFVAMKDMEDMFPQQMEILIENCDINQLWSAMLCSFRGKLKAYFCEIAAAQSMLHEDEEDYPDTGVVPNKGWWKLPMDAFGHQVNKHCFECGIPLRGKGALDFEKKEFVSNTHVNILKPKTPRLIEIVLNKSQLGSALPRATDYIANGGV